jgi:hypothetical protein
VPETPDADLAPYVADVRAALERERLAPTEEQVLRVARAWQAWSTQLDEIRAWLRGADEER